jgi:DNA-binding transcriptional LysR family regulator
MKSRSPGVAGSSLLLRQDRLQSSPLIVGQRVADHTLVAAPCSASSNGEVLSAAVMTVSRSSADIERIRSVMSEPGRPREVESDELMIQAALRGHGLAWVDIWSVERLPAERCLVSVFDPRARRRHPPAPKQRRFGRR